MQQGGSQSFAEEVGSPFFLLPFSCTRGNARVHASRTCVCYSLRRRAVTGHEPTRAPCVIAYADER